MTRRPPSPIKTLSSTDPLVRALYSIAAPVGRYFRVDLEGAERIPKEGGVMLVGNHALLGVDSWALLPELLKQAERVPRGMALRKLFDIPLVGRTLERAGMVPGEREHAVELLEREEMVLTYPGGARDSLKGRHERYQLKWDRRTGFAHVAIQAQRPILPIVGAGPDECFKLLLEDGILPMRGLSEASTLKVPIFIPLARRVPFSFLVGDLISPPKPLPSDAPAAEVSAHARAFATLVREQTQSLLDAHVERYRSRHAPKLEEELSQETRKGLKQLLITTLQRTG